MTPAPLLRQARRSAGMTQAQLADQLGTSQPVIARLERQDANPKWETVIQALRATGYDVALVPVTPGPVALDLDQLRERLAMSPGERLRTFQASQASLAGLRDGSRRVSDDDHSSATASR